METCKKQEIHNIEMCDDFMLVMPSILNIFP